MISQENKTEMTAAMRKGELTMENDNTYWTDDERNILRTKYYDGVPINEIALELGRSENAVYQQVIKMELYPVAPEKMRKRRSGPKEPVCLCSVCSCDRSLCPLCDVYKAAQEV